MNSFQGNNQGNEKQKATFRKFDKKTSQPFVLSEFDNKDAYQTDHEASLSILQKLLEEERKKSKEKTKNIKGHPKILINFEPVDLPPEQNEKAEKKPAGAADLIRENAASVIFKNGTDEFPLRLQAGRYYRITIKLIDEKGKAIHITERLIHIKNDANNPSKFLLGKLGLRLDSNNNPALYLELLNGTDKNAILEPLPLSHKEKILKHFPDIPTMYKEEQRATTQNQKSHLITKEEQNMSIPEEQKEDLAREEEQEEQEHKEPEQKPKISKSLNVNFAPV